MRSKITFLIIILMFVHPLSHTQDKAVFSYVRPFVSGGPTLNGAGYPSLGLSFDSGVIVDAPHLFSCSEAGYETGGRLNSNPNTSSVTPTRSLANQTLVRAGDWYVGVGVDWNKMRAHGFNESSVHPKATVGREFDSGYVSKFLFSFVSRGTDSANGLQGFEAQGWWNWKHAFVRMKVSGYWYHQTVTDRTNIQLANSQRSQRSATSQFQTLVGWVF